MKELEPLQKDIRDLKDAFENFRLSTSVDIASLKIEVKSSAKIAGMIWGIASGAIMAVVASFTNIHK